MTRFATGVTDQYIYFVAVDSVDLVTRKTGLSSFTVYRSRNGGTATAYTTPTITEVSAANMPGLYKFLLDEDMTIDSGDTAQECALHITATGMAPVTLTYELYRPDVTPGNQITVASGGQAAANVIAINGTSQTARDIGASVLLSSGTGTGQVSLTSGVVQANVVFVQDNAITRTSLAANTGLQVIRSGTAQAGNTTTITLDASASATDAFYASTFVYLTGGTGAGQVRRLFFYTGSTKVAFVSPSWTTAPDNTSTFAILPVGYIKSDVGYWNGSPVPSEDTAGYPKVTIKNGTGSGELSTASGVAQANVAFVQTNAISDQSFAANSGHRSIRSGTAQAGAAGSITLDASASAVDSFYRWEMITLTGGTGAGQTRQITAYVGSTKVATIGGSWATTPDNTTTFAILPTAALTQVDVQRWLGTTAATPTTSGIPKVEVVDHDATAKGQINAEVLDVLNVDTYAEPGQGAPGATISLAAKINYLYKAFRNKVTQTATTFSLYADDTTTVDQKATVSDDGTTFTRGELATGP